MELTMARRRNKVRYWTCATCAERMPRIKQRCKCGGKRPVARRPKHSEALRLPYEHYVELNGGEQCGICGAVQKVGGKRLHRDHDHRGAGRPRGILCFRCNAALRGYMTVEWLESALAYVKRAEAHDVS